MATRKPSDKVKQSPFSVILPQVDVIKPAQKQHRGNSQRQYWKQDIPQPTYAS
jgi:hypothetical protein